MNLAVLVSIGLFILTTYNTIVGFFFTRTLKQIDENQDRLSRIFSDEMKRIEERQDRLEDNQKATDDKVNNLIGQHEVVMTMGGHKK